MTAGGDETRRLREAFSSLSQRAVAQEDCPAPERLWSAVHGELPPGETRSLVDHTASCAACAEAWRLARDLARESTGESPEVARPPPAPSRWRTSYAPLAAAAAAAGILLVAGVYFLRSPSGPPDSVYRQAGQGVIRSLVPEGEPLPRERLLLRWSGPEGALYDLRVSTETLEVLATAERLDRVEYRVPETAVAGLPPGAKLLWQVEATLPDGRRLASRTFVNRLE